MSQKQTSIALLLLWVTIFGGKNHLIAEDNIMTYTPPTYLSIQMYRLVSAEEAEANPSWIIGEIHPSNTLCLSPMTNWGCTEKTGDINFAYPYNSNPALVWIETDYLLDVVSKEMGAAASHPFARHAQAITARSYAYHRALFDTHTNNIMMDNSLNSQVFIPYRWEVWNDVVKVSPNRSNPCQALSRNLLPEQKRICYAVNASKYYITGINHLYDLPEAPLFGSNAPAFAQFSADTPMATLTEMSIVPGTNPPRPVYPYLFGVTDSISSHPDVLLQGHGRGMSQNGASRWAYGNMSWTGALEPWSIQWNRVEQILVHYYTNINIRNQAGDLLLPNYRWNPLEIDWGTINRQPPIMFHGNSYPITIRIQNTGIYEWTCSSTGYQDFVLNYQWSKNGQISSGSSSISVCDLPMGNPSNTYNLIIENIPEWGNGNYALHFDIDVYAADSDNDFGFSNEGWSEYHSIVCIGNEPCGDAFLPIMYVTEN